MRRSRQKISNLFFVLADAADDAGHVAAVLFFFLEEGLVFLGGNRLLGAFDVGQIFRCHLWSIARYQRSGVGELLVLDGALAGRIG